MTFLNQFLLACLSALVISLIVAVIYFILILREVRQMIANVRRKFNAATALFDFIGIFLGGVDSAKAKIKKKVIGQMLPTRAVLIGFFAGIKKAVQVILGGEKK